MVQCGEGDDDKEDDVSEETSKQATLRIRTELLDGLPDGHWLLKQISDDHWYLKLRGLSRKVAT